MPAFSGHRRRARDLLAYLSRLVGVGTGPLTAPQAPAPPSDIAAIMHPKRGDWPTYNGTVNGNRHSVLDQVNRSNVSNLQLQWLYTIPFGSLETTPVVIDGVMYATGNNQVYALSGKTGREIWRYQRQKSPASDNPRRRRGWRQPRGRGPGRPRLLSDRQCPPDRAGSPDGRPALGCLHASAGSARLLRRDGSAAGRQRTL